MAAELMVTLAHARALGYCARGMRQWFAGQSGHTWAEFVAQGVPAAWLRASGDAQVLRVVAEAERQEASHGT